MESKIIAIIVIIFALNHVVNLILVMFFNKKIRRDVAYCGMVGYCGSVPADPNIIRIMMMYNRERGEDSTGWAVNNEIEKDTVDVNKFLSKKKLEIREDHENYTIIGHARRASSGSSTFSELAHPIGAYKNSIAKDKFDIILAMNGTLLHVKDFAEEYGIDFKYHTNSDTQIMTKAMANLGAKKYKNVLSTYNGSATLLFFSPKYPNTLSVYKDPDRPMFMWQKSEKEIYVSSMRESIEAFGVEYSEIKIFSDNHLYLLKDGMVKEKIEIRRDPFVPKPTYYNHANNSCTVVKKAEPKEELNLFIIGKNTSKFHKKKGNKIYCVLDKYYRNGHPITGKYFVTKTGKLKEKLDENCEEMFFLMGYKIPSEEVYEKIYEGCSTEGTIGFQETKFTQIPISELCDYCNYPLVTVMLEQRVWVIPKSMGSNIKKGDQINYVPMFSDFKFKMEYTGKISKQSRNKFLIDISVENLKNESSDLELIKDKHSDGENETYLESYIKSAENEDLEPSAILSNICMDVWKVNISEEIKNYFYCDVIGNMLVNSGVIESIDFDIIATEAEKGGWNSKSVNKEIVTLILLLKEKLTDNNVEDIDDDSIEDNSVKLDDMTTKDKISLFESSKTNGGPGSFVFTQSDLINSIKQSNTYVVENSSLYNDFYKGNIEYEKLIQDYIIDLVKEDIDCRYFHEALLLLLVEVGDIRTEEAVNILAMDFKEMIGSIKTSYNLYYKQCNTTKEVEGSDEDVSDIIVYVQDYIEMGSQIVQSIDAMRSDNKCTLVDNIRKKLVDIKEQIKKVMESETKKSI